MDSSSSNNSNTDELIENLEKRLSEMYEKGEETNQVFNVEAVKPVESPIDLAPKSNSKLVLLILTPVLISAIIYFVKPKSVRKGSKIDKFKFTRMVFMISIVLWLIIVLWLK